MVKKISYLLLLLLMFAGTSKSQVNFLKEAFGDEQEIVFDVSGKMISYPGTFITSNTKLKFKVRSDANIYKPYIGVLKKNLKESLEYMRTPDVRKAYECFFGPIFFKNYLSLYDKLLQLPDTCSYDSLISTLKKMNINDTIPVLNLIDNVKNQFLVKVYMGQTCVDTINLFEKGACRDGCVDYEAGEYKRLKDMNCRSCLAQAPVLVRFELIHEDPWNKTIREWFTDKAKSFADSSISKVTSLTDNLQIAADSNAIQSRYETSKRYFNQLRFWFLNWFWFNGGRLALDPFNIVTEEGRKKFGENIKEIDKKIRIAREIITFYDSAKAATIRNAGSIGNFRTIITNQDVVKGELEKAIKDKQELEKKLVTDKLLVRLSSNTILYEGRVQPSKSLSLTYKSINPHKQFDAFLGYKPVRLPLLVRRKIVEIPENEHMYLAVHNVPDTISAIRFAEKTLPFNDLEEFTRILGDQLSAYQEISESITNIKNLEDFVRAVTVARIGTKGATNNIATDSVCTEIQAYLQDLAQRLNNGELTFPPRADLFNTLASSAPVNRTEIAAATSEDAPFRDSVVIRAVRTKDSADMTKTYVKVGKLRFLQLTAGIAIARKPASNTNIDTTAGGFRVSTSDNRSTAIFGAKIYPFKNYNRDHGIIPRYPLRRLSVLGAFELLHPLDNFYLGGAYDIVPGLAISAGTNWYLRTNYQVENNVITKTSKSYERSGTYYSITVNPVLFAQYVKLFFKSL